MRRLWTALLLCCVALPLVAGGDGKTSRLPDDAGPVKADEVPTRPKPLLELGEPFLGTGTLSPGFTLPTGATWQPQFLLFGSFRMGLQSNTAGDDTRRTEWANRLNLFGNLQLSGSERLVVGMRNLDEDGTFSGHIFENEADPNGEGGQDAFNGQIDSLFFEGDIGEIFPNWSPQDFKSTDIGFALGRQPLSVQEGLLINDSVDGIGLTRNSLLPNGTSNFRATVFYAWNQLNSVDRVRDQGQLYGLFTSADTPYSTIDVDVAHAVLENDQSFTVAGISAVQRFGHIASSIRLLSSFGNDAQQGTVFLAEFSRTPKKTHNHAYATVFAAMDNFTSIARGPATGGPLGRAGINFAAVGLGGYGAPLSSDASDVAGGALGYQMFFHNNRRQLLLELGVRAGLEDVVPNEAAFTARWQAAIGRRLVWIADAFVADREEDDQLRGGGRLELLVKF